MRAAASQYFHYWLNCWLCWFINHEIVLCSVEPATLRAEKWSKHGSAKKKKEIQERICSSPNGHLRLSAKADHLPPLLNSDSQFQFQISVQLISCYKTSESCFCFNNSPFLILIKLKIWGDYFDWWISRHWQV